MFVADTLQCIEICPDLLRAEVCERQVGQVISHSTVLEYEYAMFRTENSFFKRFRTFILRDHALNSFETRKIVPLPEVFER